MKTTAFVLKGKGVPEKAFELREITLPELSPGELMVEVEAFGLNYADVMARKGLYRETPPLPTVVGYEVVGTVSEIGANVSQKWLGKRVVAFCRFGGYSKKVITKENAVAAIGEMPADKGLALATQWVTAKYMTEYTANVRKGDMVLIHAAAGGVGTALIQLCKQKNAVVIAKIGSDNKSQTVKDLGADYVVNYNSGDYKETIEKLLEGKNLDVSFNPVGGSTFKKDKALMGTGGRLVLFGGSELSGRFGIFSALSFVWKMGFVIPIGLMMGTRMIAGVNMLRIADDKPEILQQCLSEVVQMAIAGMISPVTGKIYSQAEFFRAHADLEAGTTIGKLVVTWDD